MATILLSAAGAALGGSFGGSFLGLTGAVLGRAAGATIGRAIDQRILGQGSDAIEVGRLKRYRVTGASEGASVPLAWGRTRVGGQVIWTTRYRERRKTERAGGKGGGGGGAEITAYSYSVSLAIALCAGEIASIRRIWADGIEMPRRKLNLTLYRGTEDQMPDPRIEAVEGVGQAPAYRGIAYVVIEDLKLGEFGNRVPQFSFEVIRPVPSEASDEAGKSLSEIVKGVALMPSTGEYSLATSRVNLRRGLGKVQSVNVNTSSGKADLCVSLEQLEAELSACKATSLIVSWFGDDLRCGSCTIQPLVEQTTTEGLGMPWTVSGLSRTSAGTVPREDDRPLYGGTPTDQSVVEAIKALRDAGQEVTFYPFILMTQRSGNGLIDPYSAANEQPDFPWRGRITTSIAPQVAGSPDGTAAAEAEVAAFFGHAAVGDFAEVAKDTLTGIPGTLDYTGPNEWSFRRFILHYAHLCKLAGGVESFCIGSEMRGLTQIRGSGGTFPAVAHLRALAADVKSILGPDTKISYAADWSEYFGYHPQDGSGDVYFHLDPLWADPNIDYIGIDNYMPYSDWREGEDHVDQTNGWRSIYDLDYLRANIAGGEGFDWYYVNQAARDAQLRTVIHDGAHGEHWVFRYKDLKGWWSNPHHDRIGGSRSSVSTAWVPESKPIRFTEYGCAAIDKGTNQPNRFLDPKSSESGLPHYSNGQRDEFLQAQYLRAVDLHFDDTDNNPVSSVYNEAMLDMAHSLVWAWDARPYPAFPALEDVWSDGENYHRGHWLTGRATNQAISSVIREVCRSAGLMDVDVSDVIGSLRGMSLSSGDSARSMLQPLMLAYGIDAFERDGTLQFRTRRGGPSAALSDDDVVTNSDLETGWEMSRSPDLETAGRVRLEFTRAGSSYEAGAIEAVAADERSVATSTTELDIVLREGEARSIAERWLSEARVARDTVRLALPPSGIGFGPGDLLSLELAGVQGLYRVDQAELVSGQILDAVRIEPEVYRRVEGGEDRFLPRGYVPPSPVSAVFLDLPLMKGNEDPDAPHVAVAADPWSGSAAIYDSSTDAGYRLNRILETPAVLGTTLTELPRAKSGQFDRGPALRIAITDGVLSSADPIALSNGANAIAIGDGTPGNWEILQFERAELVGSDTYDLSMRLRGQVGTDAIMPDAWPVGSIVVVLDDAVEQISLPQGASGLERHYRYGPLDLPLDDPAYEYFRATFQGVGRRPYAPAHVRARRVDESGVTINWIRRTRVAGDSWEGYDVPLGEETERYRVEVWRDGTLVRDAEVTVPTWNYSTALQAEDGVGTEFTIQVAQISQRFGVGPYTRVEIND